MSPLSSPPAEPDNFRSNLRAEHWMRRALELARRETRTLQNPRVGAVLVFEDRVLAEGAHKIFGGAHAEVEALNRIQPEDRACLPQSTLYVTLEPCSHQGKTGPCALRIICEGIGRVVIACVDPNPLVSGEGIRLLREAGVEVQTGILEAEGLELIRPFSLRLREKRPYLILKYAQTRSGHIGQSGARLRITSARADHLVHQWRSQADGILVGAGTVLSDDPQLTTRLFPGRNPVRLVLDRAGSLPRHLQVFGPEAPTILVQAANDPDLPVARRQPVLDYLLGVDAEPWISHLRVEAEGDAYWPTLFARLESLGFARLLIEGGSRLLHSLVAAGYWDEIRRFTGPLPGGDIAAPALPWAPDLVSHCGPDLLEYFYKS